MADDPVQNTADPLAWDANGKLKYKLTRPVQGEEGEITEVTLREPTTADQIASGNPVEFNPLAEPPEPPIRVKDAEMGRMIARLAGLTPIVVGRMSPKDFITIQWMIVPFFVVV